MTNKNTFLLFKDLLEPVDGLSNEDAGMFIKAILHYQNGGDIPELSPAANVTFVFTKQQLDRSDEYYELICERNRVNGAKGGRPPKPKKPSGLSGFPEKPNITQTNPDEPRITLPHPSPHPSPKKEAKKEYKPDVYLTEAEYTRLTTDYKKADVDGIIDDLSNALGNNYPKDKYKDHNKTIRKWLKRNGVLPIVPPKECKSCGTAYTGTLCLACGEVQNGQV